MPRRKEQTVGYRYMLGMHMVLCHGPVDGVYELKVDDKVAWTGEAVVNGAIVIDAEGLFGGEDREGGISGTVDIEMGGPFQVANTYLAGLLTDVPGHRGVLGLVLNKCYLGMNPYLKRWSALVQRIFVRQHGLTQWYPAKAGIPSGNYGSAITNGFAFARSINVVDHSGATAAAASGMVVTGLDPAATYTFTIADSDSEPIAWRQQNQPLWYTEFIVTANGIDTPVNATATGTTAREAFDASTPTSVVLGATTAELWFEIGVPTVFDLAASQPASTFNIALSWTSAGGGVTYDIYRSINGSAYSLVNTTPGLAFAELVPVIGVEVNYIVQASNGQSRAAETIWWGTIAGLGGEHADFNTACALRWSPDPTFGAGWGGICYRIPSGQAASTLTLSASIVPVPSPVYEGGVIVVAHKTTTGSPLYDMNPSHIIRECLTDPNWGMGYAESDNEDTTFTSAADTLYDEGLGLSLQWNEQMPIEDFIKEILKHIDAALYVSRTTGKFVLKLIRNDYVIATLPVFDESNIEKVSDFSRRGFDELYNSVTVKYVNSGTNRDSSVEVQDIAQIQMQNALINTTSNYPGITHGTNATKLAGRDLKALSSPLVTCTIYANTDAKDLNIGDCFKFSWDEYEIVEMVMRVVGISLGDGVSNTIRIQATQDVFATPNAAFVTVEDTAWENIIVPPSPVEFQLALEAPYYAIVEEMGQADTDSQLVSNALTGYVAVAAARPTGAINAVMSTDAGAGYEEVDTFDFCPSATVVTALTPMTVSVVLANVTSLASVAVDSYAQIGDEIIAVVSIVGTTLTFKRGALDTVPTEHAIDSRIYFWSNYVGFDSTEYNSGETIGVKVLPITGLGQLLPANAASNDVLLSQRALRPYPPGNFKLNNEYFPTLIEATTFEVTWTHRDRLQQTAPELISFLDASVGPEAGTTYNGYVYDDDTDVLLTSTTAVSGLSWTPVAPSAARLRVEIESVRAGLVSWQRQSWSFDFIGDNNRVSEISESRISENDGSFRQME